MTVPVRLIVSPGKDNYIGISTQKLGARGPMGLREITTYKWLIDGSGQVRK